MAEAGTARVCVCILSAGDWAETNRAAASALRFGLPVLVGVTAEPAHGEPLAGIDWRRLPWDDDFAAARNALAANVKTAADYLFWLDSDEEIAAWPKPAALRPTAPIHAVLLQDRADLAPREARRLVRRDAGVRWVGAVHETPCAREEAAGWRAPLQSGIAVLHHGYDDDAAILASLERNRRIVAAERAKGHDSPDFALEEARYAEAHGQPALALWQRAFDHPGAAPTHPGGYDRRAEPARRLCEYGIIEPALRVLADNPAIVDLHLALLETHHRIHGSLEAHRLDTLQALIESGADTRYSWPEDLRGASRRRIIRAIIAATGAADAPSPPSSEAAMPEAFRRSAPFESETLGEDLVLMNRSSEAVVTLNPAARIIWEACAEGATRSDLEALFGEAFPEAQPQRLAADIEAVLAQLLAAGLIAVAEG